jgi:acetyl esterase/lipase
MSKSAPALVPAQAMPMSSLDAQQPASLVIDEAMLAEARRFNRSLDWAPRFNIRNRAMPWLIQSLLRLSQIGADARLARSRAGLGLRAERRMARIDGSPMPVPLRVLSGTRTPRAVVLDFHGGGWVIGNAAMNDQFNAELVAACDVVVVSVDYRLLPGATLEQAMDDCLVAARWLLSGQYPGLPVYIVGESAGGHLAAVTLLRLQAFPDLLLRIDGAILYYGVYDLAGSASVRAAGPETLVLHGPSMLASMRRLTPGLSDEQRRQAPLSPLYGNLTGMPAALMFAGERDPLRDDSVAMAPRWREVADVEMHLLPEAPHGFIRFPTAMARLVRARSHAWLRERINR